MSKRLRRTAQAEDDLIEIWTYIARESPAAADRLVDRLDLRSRRLSEQPGLGVARDDLAIGLRMLPVGEYIILYREIDDGIEAVRYLHGRRDLAKLFRKEPRRPRSG